jgi:hypothetical protein
LISPLSGSREQALCCQGLRAELLKKLRCEKR